MQKRPDPLDSLVDRVEELDEASRANLIGRLARERRLMNLVLNTLREGVIVLEPNGRFEYANPSARELLGLSDRDLGSLTLWRAVPDLARTLNISGKGFLQEEANVSRMPGEAYFGEMIFQ